MSEGKKKPPEHWKPEGSMAAGQEKRSCTGATYRAYGTDPERSNNRQGGKAVSDTKMILKIESNIKNRG